MIDFYFYFFVFASIFDFRPMTFVRIY